MCATNFTNEEYMALKEENEFLHEGLIKVKGMYEDLVEENEFMHEGLIKVKGMYEDLVAENKCLHDLLSSIKMVVNPISSSDIKDMTNPIKIEGKVI